MSDGRDLVPMYDPLIEREEIDAAVAALETKWLGMGAFVREFEQAVREFLGTERHVVAVSTGHAALHLGLRLAGVGAGDEVITPAFNNVADFQAIVATGARPVFCDVDDRTLCIDAASAASVVTERTKAIVPIDYGAALHDADAIRSLAAQHGLRVVHDAAHSFGSSSRDGTRVGADGDISMFSFDPVKNLTCIDGGALVVDTAAEAERLHAMRLIGMQQPADVMYRNQRAWTYDVAEPGFRYHMPNLHAAVGSAQLAKMPRITASRQRACRYFDDRLRDVPGLTIADVDVEGLCPFLYWVRVPAAERDEFREHLLARGVESGIHWQAGHRFSLFADCRRAPLPVTERVDREVVSLPFHSGMTDATLARVADAVTSYFAERPVG